MKQLPISPINNSLQRQLTTLETILLKSTVLKAILGRVPSLALPNWYVGAGCIAQTVWNFLSGRDLLSDINDVDLVYFDESDLSSESESLLSDMAGGLFSDLPIKIDLKNQARVHIWYEKHFGYPIPPHQSIEEAINSWPTTATAVAVRYEENGSFIVYTPYGLDDLFGLGVRPNKVQITEEIYLAKVKRWKACRPELRIIPW
jgi:hypothetical protein